MNALTVGSNKAPLLHDVPKRDFLFIDDGPLIDQLHRPRARTFDVAKHRFNPLKDMDYPKALAFLAVLDAIFPEGASTLTKANSDLILLEALLGKQPRIDHLVSDSKDPYQKDAYRKIRRLLLSPVLKNVFTGKTSRFSLKGSIFLRLDRAKLGSFDCFVLANLIASRFQGTVVIPDFGFYACTFHGELLHQNRLVVGVNSFDEVPKWKSQLLLIKDKKASTCTPEDAAVLATYAGHIPGTEGHSTFVKFAIA